MLSNQIVVPVRFSEVDSLKVVWHGNYVRYFEDGRESFGNTYGLSYLDVVANGYVTPIVKLNLDFKKSIRYGESVLIEITYVDTRAAKLMFSYKIYRSSDNVLAATGETTQVFLTTDGELSLIIPSFFEEWKKKMGNSSNTIKTYIGPDNIVSPLGFTTARNVWNLKNDISRHSVYR